jgi:hypothetical protein
MADKFNMGDLCQKKIHDYLIAKLRTKCVNFWKCHVTALKEQKMTIYFM